jgi:hypothetical protein
MTHLPLAFSVHHFISSVGADAGFASIIGLAILVLLYFAQARETSTLRDRADEAEQRAAQLEARLSQVANAARAQAQQAGPRPVPSPIARPLANPAPARTATAGAPAVAGAAAAAAPAAVVAIPSAPAGVGAPPLTDATHLIPLPAVAASAPSAPVAPPQPSPSVPDPVAADGPAPATAAGAAATATAVAEAPPGLETTGGNGVGGDTASHPLFDEPDEEPLPRVQLRPGGAQPRPLPPLRQPPSRGSSRGRRGLAALIMVLGVAAVIAVLLIVTSGGGKSNPSGNTTTSNAPSARHKTKAKVFDKGAVTVTVLNGTATAGLAAHVLSQLGNDGFKQGTAANAANATQATTAIAYVQGQKAAAQQVAKSLKLSTSSVAPITPATQQLACPQASCNVDVVVTIGQDLVGH